MNHPDAAQTFIRRAAANALRTLALALFLLHIDAPARAQHDPWKLRLPGDRLHALVSDWGHSFVPTRTSRTRPPPRESPKLQRSLAMIAAGSGLALGAIVAMASLRGSRFQCGESDTYRFVAGGITGATGLAITFAGWGELRRVPRAERTLTRAQRIWLPFLVAGSALLGAAPIAARAVFCRDD